MSSNINQASPLRAEERRGEKAHQNDSQLCPGEIQSVNDVAIRVRNMGKCYQIYDAPNDRLKESIYPHLRRLIRRPSRHYYREFWALKDVTLEVKRGEAVGIIGRNGSGKSTLLQVVCGTLSQTNGSVETFGRIAALLELGSGFNPDFTGRENVYMNAALLGLSIDEIDSRFDHIAAFADIGEFIEQPVKTYSSGMVVRLAFAVSISVEPEILVIDEALSVGDMAFQQKCLQRLTDLRNQGTTILFVTHDIMLTRNYCSKVVYLDRGLVKMTGDAESVGEMYIYDLFSERQTAQGGEVLEWREGGRKDRLGFGTSLGRILNVRLTSSRSAGNLFHQGERVLVDICGEVSPGVKNPEFVFQIRDSRGYVLYGICSRPTDLRIIPYHKHININAQLSFTVDLGAGNYAIALAINDRQGGALFSVLDKIVGIAEFSVAQNMKEEFHGCINLHGTWEPPTQT